VLYFGAAAFKISRLLFIAMLSVHFFACIFYRVKEVSALKPDDVATFYTSKNVNPNVSCCVYCKWSPQHHDVKLISEFLQVDGYKPSLCTETTSKATLIELFTLCYRTSARPM
jgi:hypothetical protein